MTSLFFSLPGDLTLKLESDFLESFHPDDLVLAQAYLPGLKYASAPMTQVADIVLTHRQTRKTQTLEETGRYSFVLHATWTNHVSPDTYFLLYSLTRRAWLDRHLFSVHAACVEDDAGAILLVGHSGVGKTRIAFELIQQGKRLFAGNKTVIEWTSLHSMEAIAGTQTMTLHAQTIPGTSKEIVYGNRKAFIMTQEKYSKRSHVPVRAIVFVRLNDGVESTEHLSPMSALHRLFPFFLDLVNADVLIGTAGNILTDKRPAGIESFLITQLWNSIQTLPVVRIEGSLAYLSQTISTL